MIIRPIDKISGMTPYVGKLQNEKGQDFLRKSCPF
jgi:hypothetical protein